MRRRLARRRGLRFGRHQAQPPALQLARHRGCTRRRAPGRKRWLPRHLGQLRNRHRSGFQCHWRPVGRGCRATAQQRHEHRQRPGEPHSPVPSHLAPPPDVVPLVAALRPVRARMPGQAPERLAPRHRPAVPPDGPLCDRRALPWPTSHWSRRTPPARPQQASEDRSRRLSDAVQTDAHVLGPPLRQAGQLDQHAGHARLVPARQLSACLLELAGV